MPIPIIFFQRKQNPTYLVHVLDQANRSNAGNPIHLIGDQPGNTRGLCIWHNYEDYKTEAQERLVKHYRHFSTNGEFYEMICIARWFIIKEFLKKKRIKQCFITDSDVLLFGNVMDIRRKYFKNYRCTLTHNTSAGISFMNDVSVLDEYCNFVIDCYTKKDKFHFDKVKSHYECLQNNGRPGGVCDMTFWGLLRNMNTPGDFGESMAIMGNEKEGYSTFDHNINVSYGYKHDGKIKQFSWVNGEPFCEHKRIQKPVKFNCIHFQGAAKPYIIPFYKKAIDNVNE